MDNKIRSKKDILNVYNSKCVVYTLINYLMCIIIQSKRY